MAPIRILHVLGQLNLGGAESRIMDLYRAIDRDKIQFDFVVHTDKKCYFDDEILTLGGHIYHIPRFKIYNIFSYQKAWKELFRKHNDWKLIEGHMTSTASIYLPIAKKAGLVTTSHARSAGTDPGLKGLITRILRRNLSQKADYLLTCSELAGIAVYGQKAVDNGQTIFLPNAIYCSKFTFDKETRDSIRSELGIEDKLVLGHVGRFHFAKNHTYLIHAYAEFLKAYDKDCVLLLIGDGPLKPDTEELVNTLGIADKVIFAGNKSSIYNYYMAMDMFVYPSRYEGMPGTVVEAQASGLKVLMSNEICDEVIATDLVETLSIAIPPEAWAKKLVSKVSELTPLPERTKYADIMENSGFDAIGQSQILTPFYETGIWSK